MNLPERWEAAKNLKLCYRYLGGDHSGGTCVRSRVCGINNFKNTQNRLLHRDTVPADRSEQVNSHDRCEVEEGASGDSQAVAESETITVDVLLLLLLRIQLSKQQRGLTPQ